VIHGLKLVAVAVVAQSVWGMARALAPDRVRATIALAAGAVAGSIKMPASTCLFRSPGALGWYSSRTETKMPQKRQASETAIG
jgi:chromate transport protein ChrA